MSNKQGKPGKAKRVSGQVTRMKQTSAPLLTSEKYTSQLKKRSQWWASIMDPASGGGARIPDPSGYHTACYQYVKRVTVPISSGGVAGLRIVDPCTVDSVLSANLTAFGNYQITSVGSTPADLKFGDGATAATSLLFAEANSVLAQGSSSLASLIRVVSGSVTATYTGTSLSDAGTLVSYTNPAGIENSNVADSRLRNLYGASLMPIKANRASIARLLPIQRAFRGNTTVAGTILDASADYRAFRTANRGVPLDGTNSNCREFGVYAVGATPSTGSVEFVIVMNYEFIPRFNTGGFLEVTPSPQDPLEENFVLTNLSEGDATGTISMREFSEQPSASGVAKAERDSIGGPLSSMTETLGFLGPILELGLPMLAALL